MAIEFYSSIDLNKNELQNAVIQVLSTKPSSPAQGQIFFDSDVTQLQVYNGSAWQGLATEVVDTDDIFNAGLRIGRDSHNMLDFETADNTIDIYLNNAKDFTFTANTFTAQSGSTIAAQALTATTGTFSGTLLADDGYIRTTNTTNATTTTDGPLRSDGGLSIASDAIIGNDLYLLSDGAKFGLGAGKDVTITHDGGTGGTLASPGNFKVDSTAGTLILDGHTSAAVNSVGNVTLQSTGSAGKLSLISAHTAGRALHIDADANAGSIVDIDAGILDVDVTGVTTFDTTEFKLGTLGLRVTNTTASAADTGAKINLVANDGAAMADNHRLGVINFMGAEDDAASLTIGASIEAFCDAGWSATENGTRLVLSTTDENASTSAALTLDSDQKASFSADVAIAGDLVVTGTTTTNIVETVTTSSGVVFEGTAADGHDATLKSVVASSDKTYTLPNVTGHVALFAADPSTTTISSTPAELNILDGVTSTTAELNILDGVTSTAAELNILDGVTSTAAELNILDGVTSTAAEINLIDGGTARGTTAVADGDGILTNDGGTMRMTKVETFATYFAAEVSSQRMVVADIDVSSLTDANIVTITHNLGTADVMVQVYDKTTEANIMCDIARTTDDFSTASTSVISIDFGTAPPNDCRALITSLASATASGTVAYT